MSIKATIESSLKAAMRQRDKKRVSTLRFLLAAIKQQEINKQALLQESEVMKVLNQQVKQRRQAIAQYQKAHREELVAKETEELAILQQFLPPPLSNATLDKLITDTIKETKVTTLQEIGKVMSALKVKVNGRADMKAVGMQVRKKLENNA